MEGKGAFVCFFFQAEDGIRDLVRSRGLGDVYKRQSLYNLTNASLTALVSPLSIVNLSLCQSQLQPILPVSYTHLTLPTIYPV